MVASNRGKNDVALSAEGDYFSMQLTIAIA